MDQCGMCPIEPHSSILCLMAQYWALRLNIEPWGSIGHVSYWASRLNIETWVSLLSLKAQYWAPRLNIEPQGSILSSEAQYWDSRLNNEPQGSIGDSCVNRTLVSYWDSSPTETRHLQTGLMLLWEFKNDLPTRNWVRRALPLLFLREFGNFFHTFLRCGKKDCVNFKFAAGNNLYLFPDLVLLKFTMYCGMHFLTSGRVRFKCIFWNTCIYPGRNCWTQKFPSSLKCLMALQAWKVDHRLLKYALS